MTDLGQGDWTVPREEFSYTGFYVPEQYRVGALAESWEQPDLGHHQNQGPRRTLSWHDKAPANGREVTAEDVRIQLERLYRAPATASQSLTPT